MDVATANTVSPYDIFEFRSINAMGIGAECTEQEVPAEIERKRRSELLLA